MAQATEEALPITRKVIRWARKRAGFSLDDAQKIFKNIDLWEKGGTSPSYPQLEQMAEKFKCPVAVFFFPKPPDVPEVETSFRTLSAEDFAHIPRNVRAFLHKGQAMQINLAELNDGKNPAPHQITRDLKFSPSASLDKIADKLRDYLGVSLQEQARWKTVEVALEKWREAFARVGVFVFKDAFRADSYCGFCLYDNEFPIIYVNNSSAKARQIFTLFHELGHLLFQTSGIDLVNDDFIQNLANNPKKIEIICNGLAARFLVPDDEFENLLKGKPADRDTAAQLASYFSVSRDVIYRKFLDRELIGADEYKAAADAWKKQMKSKKPGGSYYNTQFSYLGSRYIDLAFSRYYQRRFDDVQLSDYLNIKPKNLPQFEQKYGGG